MGSITIGYINGFLDAVRDVLFFYLLYLCFCHAAYNRPVNFTIPTHTVFVVRLYLFRFRIILPYLFSGKIQTVFIKNVQFLFVVFYQSIDKIGVKVFYFVHKVVLLEELILGGKDVALIHFTFLHNLTPFADISIFIKYLFLGADVFPLLVIEHIPCCSFFYGFG